MEGQSKGSSSEGRPPNPLSAATATAYRPCFSTDRLPLPCNKSLIRHPSLVSSFLLSHSFYFYFWGFLYSLDSFVVPFNASSLTFLFIYFCYYWLLI